MIYPQEQAAATEIFDKFKLYQQGMLLAQMQSGKTSTFKLVASEMIRAGIIDYAVVCSGNRETDLRDQTMDSSIFKRAYRKFLRDVHKLSADDADVGDEIVDKIKIVWGQDLKKFQFGGRVLYIWEESHYGQSKQQQIDVFFERNHIKINEHLPEGNFILSVSATPFSEIADYHRLKQYETKFIVKLIPSPEYLSVKKMWSNGQIRNMEDLRDFSVILDSVYDGYSLIRASDKLQRELSVIAREKGFDIIKCDMGNKFDLNEKLCVYPATKTIIFIKQMCRMGKRIDRQHIRFCMETSDGNTDTLLQSLVGRICGYKSRSGIIIYVKQLNVSEIEKFIDLYDGDLTSIPSKAMNVCKNEDTRCPIIPIRVKKIDFPTGPPLRHVDRIKHCVKQCMFSGKMKHNNTLDDMEKVMKIMGKAMVTDMHVQLHVYHPDKQGDIYKRAIFGVKDTIVGVKDAFKRKIATAKFGVGAGASDTEDEVILYETEKYVYVVMQIEKRIVPFTTGNEIFNSEDDLLDDDEDFVDCE